MEKKDFINKFVKCLIRLQIANKLFHWNTKLYSQHKASDEFNTNISAILDKFVEVFIGTYDIILDPTNIKLDNDDITIDGIIKMLKYTKKFLTTLESNKINDTDLLTIRDEFIVEINQTLYLLRLQ
jgi:hypothetical protein